MDVIMEQISKKLEESVNKKNKGGMKVKAHQIKQHCWLFVKAQARFISLYDSYKLCLIVMTLSEQRVIARKKRVETLERLKIQALIPRRKKT